MTLTPPGRLHGLDALRAGALLLGVVLHSTMPFLLPPGLWAVGTTQPNMLLAWLAFYLHAFRLELFFVLAGFFGALVVSRRGAAAYARDRLIRIVLVFAVALYPMKFALASLWIVGGQATGWLPPEPGTPAHPWNAVAMEWLAAETWPDIALTHLWFLYVLGIIVALVLGARALLVRWPLRPSPAAHAIEAATSRAIASWWAPLLLAVIATPLLAQMRGMDIDTPDRSFAWHLPVMALYGLFYCLGWWLHRHADLLGGLARRWMFFVILGLVASAFASTGVAIRYAMPPALAGYGDALRWAASFATSLTMAASVLGWIGASVDVCRGPSRASRYLADASYFIYIAHLPVVVGLQVWLAPADLPWWIHVPFVNVVTVGVLLAAYHVGVRFTWVGAWLNGHRHRRPETKPLAAPSLES
jgi:glucan biosynthesis protein C